MNETLTPEVLLRAYQAGIFPMSDGRHDPDIYWVDPRKRGVMPLDGFHISRSLAKQMRKGEYAVTADQHFDAVLQQCAARKDTWISTRIEKLYQQLFSSGFAHSIEVSTPDGTLFGGVYGVAIRGVFFGESMFSSQTGGSKIALAYLVDRLRMGGFTLFDTQFITPHLESLGGVEISRKTYHDLLAHGLSQDADFWASGPGSPAADQVLQRNAQTS
ncbi:leucyl/phenylalanyl-tRNA--protein transferase [Nereida sp. MMG024]|nr:leucyl/phenylalanyl-tRNA--protein transferase [Nereida sp. MMG025]MCF6443721.1 leucyl/phenylalanyl-tRNA--protein transferase [Nereida sp. MMG025]